MEGLGNTRVFARMPGVFEPCTRLDHLGWLRYLALKPRFRSIGSLASCSATGPSDLGDLGITLEQQLNQKAGTSLVPVKPFAQL